MVLLRPKSNLVTATLTPYVRQTLRRRQPCPNPTLSLHPTRATAWAAHAPSFNEHRQPSNTGRFNGMQPPSQHGNVHGAGQQTFQSQGLYTAYGY